MRAALLSLLALAACGAPPPPIRGTLTAPPSVARSEHTATLLADGSVLVAGGVTCMRDGQGRNVLAGIAAAETYDPAANAWSPAGALTTPRSLHGAAALPDGRVIVVGGARSDDQSPLSGTNLFDPSTRSWSAGPELSVPRASQAQATMADGRVLVVGGSSTAAGTTDAAATSAELFDPARGTFARVASPNRPRSKGHRAIALLDGRVLVAGGRTDAAAVAGAEVWEPATGLWRDVAPPATPRPAVKLLLRLADGRVLLYSACPTSAACVGAELFDPKTGRWSPVEDIGHHYWTGLVVPSGAVLLFGRTTAQDAVVRDVLAYDPAKNRWSTPGRMAADRFAPVPTLLPDGRVLLTSNSCDGPEGASEVYAP